MIWKEIRININEIIICVNDFVLLAEGKIENAPLFLSIRKF